MIENISTFEELSDYWSFGEGRLLMDHAAGDGRRHIGDVVFNGGGAGEFWFGQMSFTAPERETPTDYVGLMGNYGIRLTAFVDETDHTTPARFRKMRFAFVMVKSEWTLMAVREKLSAA